MKTLLITYYWYPYNNSGTFRWLNFGKYIDFDVLTASKPLRCFIDYSIKAPDKKVFRFGKNIPGIVWGVLVLFRTLFTKYDLYIITCPPESLLFSAWILQLFGKNVLVDMRDSINRDAQFFKRLIKIYQWFYKRIRNVVVSWQFIDPSKEVIYNGYEQIEKLPYALNEPYFYKERVCHAEYLSRLSYGYIPDQSGKPKGYATSSLHTILKLGYKLNQEFHKEVGNINLKSFAIRSNEMMKIINKIVK